MSEKIPIPLGKLPQIALRGLIEEYYNVVVVLTDKLSEAIGLRLKIDPDTREALSDPDGHPDEPLVFDDADDLLPSLVRAKFDATGFLDVLDGLFKEHDENFWEVHKDDLGDFLERLIHHKHACEMELIGLDIEFEDAMHKTSAEA